MPFKSKAQERLFQARAHGWSPKGGGKDLPSPKVARKFIRDSAGEGTGKLPERVVKCDGGRVRRNW